MTSHDKTLTKQPKAWNDLFTKLTSGAKHEDFSMKIYSMCMKRGWIDEKRRQNGSL